MPTSSKPVKRVLVGVRLPVPLVEWVKAAADKRGMTLQRFVEQVMTLYMIRAKMRDKKGH